MVKRRLVIFGCTVLMLIGCIFGFSSKAIDDMNLGLDLKGGFEILYEVKPLDNAANKEIDMSAVSKAIQKRINVLGVSEPEISIEGNRIRVQLAGIKDIESARKVIGSTAILSFRDVDDKLLMDANVLSAGGARLEFDQNTARPVVSLKIADKKKFAEVTKEIAAKASKGENLMVAWLDYTEDQSYVVESRKEEPAYISAASVKEELNSDSVIISGNFTEEEAQQLADLLNSGSLTFKMEEIYSNVVSASLGEGSFDKTIFAGMIGVLGIMLLMILLYRFLGIISAITIAAYTLFTLVTYSAMGGVFTLSGIAGLVLGVGMAVDSSVITFERIKDCLLMGRSVKQAYKEGTTKSFSTIFDSQLTTLISGFILFKFGTGSVRGFATMLLVSTITTIIFNVVIVRFLLRQVVESGWLDNKKTWFAVKEKDIPDLSKGETKKYKGLLADFDFVKNAKYFWAISVGVLVLALAMMGFHSMQGEAPVNLGIDFVSGTKITLTSETTFDAKRIEKEFSDMGIKVSDVKLAGDNDTIATISIKKPITEKQRSEINNYAKNTYKAEASDSTVSPIVGRELVRNAIIMSLLSWIGILIYVSFRFKWDYAVSGIVALVHDVLIIIAFFIIFNMEITTDIIAVLLAIIGYSINDSIVIFDRIRETIAERTDKRTLTSENYKEIVNTAMQDTISRSIITTVTTLIPIIALIVLGSPNIFDFNIALLVGLVAGSISSVFIAAQLWCYLRSKFNHPEHAKKEKKKKQKREEVDEFIIPGIND